MLCAISRRTARRARRGNEIRRPISTHARIPSRGFGHLARRQTARQISQLMK